MSSTILTSLGSEFAGGGAGEEEDSAAVVASHLDEAVNELHEH